MLEVLPPPISGWHRRHFCNGRIELSVFFGDVDECVNDFVERDRRGVDAWFIDGFSPERNSAMWNPELFKSMAQGTKQHGTVTTFSAAGHIRRTLENANFTVSRIDATPHKRHTTLGVFQGEQVTHLVPTCATVVGAGVSGSSLARALANEQVRVDLIDTNGIPASKTSAIPVAIQHGRLSSANTKQVDSKRIAIFIAELTVQTSKAHNVPVLYMYQITVCRIHDLTRSPSC